jgi:hypothetical protein
LKINPNSHKFMTISKPTMIGKVKHFQKEKYIYVFSVTRNKF